MRSYISKTSASASFFVHLMVAQKLVRAVSKHSFPCRDRVCKEQIYTLLKAGRRKKIVWPVLFRILRIIETNEQLVFSKIRILIESHFVLDLMMKVTGKIISKTTFRCPPDTIIRSKYNI